MGFDKSIHSENTYKTDTEVTNSKSNTKNTLIKNITSSKKDQPSKVLHKVLGRFERMSRSRQSHAHSVYCGKFNAHTPLSDFKKKALRALTTKSGSKCSAQEFKNEAVKRVKTLDIILEENTLFEAKVYSEARKPFIECIQKSTSIDVGKAESTRKVH